MAMFGCVGRGGGRLGTPWAQGKCRARGRVSGAGISCFPKPRQECERRLGQRPRLRQSSAGLDLLVGPFAHYELDAALAHGRERLVEPGKTVSIAAIQQMELLYVGGGAEISDHLQNVLRPRAPRYRLKDGERPFVIGVVAARKRPLLHGLPSPPRGQRPKSSSLILDGQQQDRKLSTWAS